MTAITGTSTRRFGNGELPLGMLIGGNDAIVATGKLVVRGDDSADMANETAKWWG